MMHSCLDVTLGSKGIILALPESACYRGEPPVRTIDDLINKDDSWRVFCYLELADG